MATIRNRNGRWHVQVRRSGSKSVNRTFTLKSDAQLWAREQERTIELDGLDKPNKELLNDTLSDLLKRYELEIAPSKKSYHVERHYFALLRRQLFANLSLKNLRASDIQNWIDERNKTHEPASTVRVAGIIERVINIAIKNWDYPLVNNPMQRVIKPANTARPILRLSTNTLQKLRNPSSKIGWIVLFALETGMRRSEIANLKWPDINLNEQLVYVSETKNGYARHVPLSSRSIDAIQHMDGNNEYVFGMSSNAIRLAWQRLKNLQQIEGVRFHDLRHEAISGMFERGLTMAEVAMLSGHRTVSQLFRYAHADIQKVREKLAQQE
ncbi:site-specific recombinase XerD [SAR116 cluster alpha proteobacterium HIMB100]|nr:site-specific recombinase XerD [SAR116 cluster alpha proteobacterium HIMB100]